MGDTAILTTIIVIFVILGAALPFIHSAFGETSTNVNTEGVEFASGQGFSTSNTSILGIVVSIFTMFFWTFGSIPLILEIVIFVPVRIMFMVLLFKLVRGVGG